MRFILLLFVAGAMYLTPVLLFDQKVLPELFGLKNFYSNIESVANDAAQTGDAPGNMLR
jgi:hypothetical protein